MHSTQLLKVSVTHKNVKMLKLCEDFTPRFLNSDFEIGDDNTNNGQNLNNVYIPNEILSLILSYVDPDELLKYCLVCRKWNSVIKSYLLWSTVYYRNFKRVPKKLPWFLYYCLSITKYFDTNLLRNGNGEEIFKYWQIYANSRDEFVIEAPPYGVDTLPPRTEDFNGKNSCFASFRMCNKHQRILLNNNKLLLHILNTHKPHIYISEWIAGKSGDYTCVYTLRCKLIGKIKNVNIVVHEENVKHETGQWQDFTWTKKEILIKNYPKGVVGIIFEHRGPDTEAVSPSCGTKMAGGVVKILFDSIK